MAKTHAGRTRLVRLAVLAVFAGGLLLFFVLGGEKYVSFEAIKQSREALLDYKEQHFWLALAGTFLVFTASTAFSLPIATILSLAAGLLFGRWLGTAIIVVAGSLGATLLLLAARYVFTDLLKARAAGHVKKFDEGFRRSAFLYVVFLRIVPLFPFWLVNLVSAFTKISVPVYVAATAIGMIPISFVWANLGESLEHVNALRDAISGPTLIALTVLGVLGVAAIFAKNYMLGKKPKPGRASAH